MLLGKVLSVLDGKISSTSMKNRKPSLNVVGTAKYIPLTLMLSRLFLIFLLSQDFP